jgi:serine protease Do
MAGLHRWRMRPILADLACAGILWVALTGMAAARLPDKPPPPGKPPPLEPTVNRPPGASLVSSGTGFLAAAGHVLTNNHVVDHCGYMVARNAAGRELTAKIDITDSQRDLALLSLAEDFAPALTFRSGPAIRRGETVITYGFPLSGLLSSGPTLTSGQISALSGMHDNADQFQISAPVQPGNSGGPLLDAQGNVAGIIVAKLNAARIAEMDGGDIPQNVNFAIKGSVVMEFLRENTVTVATAASTGPDQSAAALGDIADPATVFLRCYR